MDGVGEWFDGGWDYMLYVFVDVLVRLFWFVIVYDVIMCCLIDNF